MSLGASSVAGRVHEFMHPSLASKVVIEQQPDKVLGHAEADGTNVRLWPAALVFGRYLCAHPELVRGKRVIELGAGTGVAGLICAALGARHVTITDVPEALRLIRTNVEQNGTWLESSRVTIAPCTWGDEDHILRLLNGTEAGGGGEEGGVGRDETGEAYDVILSCELVYKQPEQVLDALAETQRRLSGPRSLNILVYEFRGHMLSDLPYFEAVTEAFDAEPEATSLAPFGESGDGAVDDEDDSRYVYIYRHSG